MREYDLKSCPKVYTTHIREQIAYMKEMLKCDEHPGDPAEKSETNDE